MKRRVVQIFSLLFFNSYYLSFLKFIPCPVLNCYACPLAIFACPIGTIQFFIIIGSFPFLTIGLLGIIGSISGKAVCGWLCPFGFFQDLLYKIRSRKFKIPEKLGYLKFLILILLVIAIPFFTKDFWFCKLCPAGTLEAGIPLAIFNSGIREMIGLFFWLKITIFLLIIILIIYCQRGFCKIFCPLGAIFSLFNRLSLLKPKAKGCPIKICKNPDSLDCIRCLDCIKK